MTTPSGSGRVNTPIIVSMTVIACVALIVSGGLLLAGKGISDLLGLVGLLIVPLLGVFGAHVVTKLDNITAQTNGNNAKLADAVIQQMQVNQATPVVIVKPSEPTPEPEVGPTS